MLWRTRVQQQVQGRFRSTAPFMFDRKQEGGKGRQRGLNPEGPGGTKRSIVTSQGLPERHQHRVDDVHVALRRTKREAQAREEEDSRSCSLGSADTPPTVAHPCAGGDVGRHDARAVARAPDDDGASRRTVGGAGRQRPARTSITSKRRLSRLSS